MTKRFLIPALMYFFVLICFLWANTKFDWLLSTDIFYVVLLSIVGVCIFLAVQLERFLSDEEHEREKKKVVNILRQTDL